MNLGKEGEQSTLHAAAVESATPKTPIRLAIEGAMDHRRIVEKELFTPEAQEVLADHLETTFTSICAACQGRWNNVSTHSDQREVKRVPHRRRFASTLMVNVGGEVVKELEIPDILTNEYGIDGALAKRVTTNTFHTTLKYLQHGVTNEEDLKAKKGRTGSFTKGQFSR